jgi:hypothetical protein
MDRVADGGTPSITEKMTTEHDRKSAETVQEGPSSPFLSCRAASSPGGQS